MRELILGGQKSGKSRLAEERARAWLAQSPSLASSPFSSRSAVLMATALAQDEEMGERIARHQADRLAYLPGMRCVEEARDVGQRLGELSDAKTLVIVDCLTLWLTQLMMPLPPAQEPFSKQNRQLAGIESIQSATDLIVNLLQALRDATGPVVLVSNEIGLGVIPMGREVRQFVDELGKLNQAVAAQCERVTFMAAGCELTLKEPA
jgi:adenosylcobinamide kinase / adenosylcobinamide-phosphate guanylyltransferase